MVADNSTLPFNSAASGIIGLGTKTAPDFSDTFLGGLFSSHPDFNSFSYGMALNGATSGNADGGVLHLVSTDPSFYSGDVATLPVVSTGNQSTSSDTNEWTVQLKSWKLQTPSGLSVGNTIGGLALVQPYTPNIILPQNEARALCESSPL